MELRYIKVNPSGNTTILVADSLPRDKYADVSIKLMADTNLCAEQVGFVEKPENPAAAARLQMMGGEFCGNASRSFAAWIALGGLEGYKLKNFSEEEKEVTIEISGHEGILTAKVQNGGSDHACIAEIEMPLPEEIRHGNNDLMGEYSIVIFEGITHVILWGKPASEEYIDIVSNFLADQGLDNDCFGIEFYDETTASMIPVVYVGAVGSLVWESSCGSGSVAVAAAIVHKQNRSIEHMQIRQPGGDLFVSVDWDCGIKAARLSGDIIITAAGTAYID